MTFRLIDHCRIEFADDTAPIEHGCVRSNGDTVTVSSYRGLVTLSDGRTVDDDEESETGRASTREVIEQATVKQAANGKLAVTGFARSRKGGPDEETPYTITVIPDLRRCTSC